MFATRQVIGIALGVVVVSCRNDAQDVIKVRSSVKESSTVQYGIEVIYSDTSEVQWKLQANELEEERVGGMATREVFRGTVRALQLLKGRPTGRSLEADEMVRNLRDQSWVLKGGVEVRQGRSKTLKTESLTWDRKARKITGDHWVEINDGGQLLSGKGFEALEDLSTYSIYEVSGHVDERMDQ